MPGKANPQLLITQYGRESVGSPGPVACPNKFPSVTRVAPAPVLSSEQSNISGSLRNYQTDVFEDYTKFTFTVKLDYVDFGWFLCGLYGPPDQELDHTGSSDLSVGSYAHYWRPSSLKAPNLQFLTLQCGWLFHGSPTDIVNQYAGVFFSDVKLKIQRGPKQSSVSLEITGYGKKRTDTSPTNQFSPGDNAQFKLDLTGATGGTLKVVNPANFGATVAFDPTTITASTLQTDLRAVGVYGTGNITVTSPSSGIFLITAVGALVNTKMALPKLDTTSMTGVATIDFVRDTTDNHKIRGGPAVNDFVRVLPRHGSVYYDTFANVFDGSGHLVNSTKLLHNYSMEVNLANINDVHFVQDSANTSYLDSQVAGTDQSRKEEIVCTALFDTQSLGWWTDFENGDNTKYFVFKSTSDKNIPGTTTPYQLRLVAHVGLTQVEPYGDMEKSATIKATMEMQDDMDFGDQACEWCLVNGVPSYIVA